MTRCLKFSMFRMRNYNGRHSFKLVHPLFGTAFMTAQQFVEDGADEIQHMNFIFLNFMFDTVKDTRGRLRFTEVAAHAAEIDPASQRVQDFIRFLQQVLELHSNHLVGRSQKIRT